MRAVATNRSRTLSVLTVVMMCVTLLYSRGMLLGNGNENIALFASATTIFLCVLIRPEKCKIAVLITCLLFFSYCFIQPYILGSGNYSKVNQYFVWWIAPAVATCMALGIPRIQKWFCDALIVGLCLISISYIVTFLFSLAVGWDALRIAVIDYNYYYDAPLLFPFTIVYGSGEVGGMTIWRLLGFARESGIMQMLFTWGFFIADSNYRHSGVIKVLLALGVLACFSTTGLVIFVFAILLNILIDRQSKFISFNTLLIISTVVLLAWILLGSGSYGLSNRLSVSYIDRSTAMEYSAQYLKQAPLFGVGFMSLPDNVGVQWNICLLGSAGQIGYVGLLLFFTIYIVGFFACRTLSGKRCFFFANISFFLTTILAQPLFYSGLIYMFLFFDYDSLAKCSYKVDVKTRKDKTIPLGLVSSSIVANGRGDRCE